MSFKTSLQHLRLTKRPGTRQAQKRIMGKSLSTKGWPALADWDNRQAALAALTARKLGIDSQRIVYGHIGASQTLDILGPDSFAQVLAVRIPGRVIWCNFELAAAVGFDVPPSQQMTPEFQEQLLDAFSYRAVQPGEETEKKTITMFADKYGGAGVRPALGAGRAGFLPFGNLYIKGIGFTPLFKHDDPDDFAHSHGGVQLEDCLSEAVFGEVNENLFTQGSTRVVAVIDQDKYVTAPNGIRAPVALVVRTGTQLRPAHLLIRGAQPGVSVLEKFIGMTKATGQLVTHRDITTGKDIPDLRATMLRIIDDHALATAEQFRWRMIHGALSSSNMEISGAMLDLPTQSAQPRTAPVWALDYPDSVFGREHIERGVQLTPVYRKLVNSIPPPQRPLLRAKGINLCGEMDKAYHRHLQVKLLCAVGLKTELAARIQVEHADLARRFMDLMLKMAELRNQGSVQVTRSMVESVSSLDVFHLLGSFPAQYFADPNADHAEHIRAGLKPAIKGNRYHVAKKQAAVKVFIKEFASLYRELMNACEGYAKQYYGDWSSMQSSITARAAFENQPLDALYSKKLYEDLSKAIEEYRATGNVNIIQEAINQRIMASLRSVDALLAQGKARRMAGGGIEMEMRTIDGISYSVRAWNDARQTRRLRVCIPVERKHGVYLTGLPDLPSLTKRQIQSLRYRFTTDGRITSSEVSARLASDERRSPIIDFAELRIFPMVGQLEGACYLAGTGDFRLTDETPSLGRYKFAIPDKEELMKMIAPPVVDSQGQSGCGSSSFRPADGARKKERQCL
ncbi:MAG: hypothetical protein H7Y30_06695 [Pyrinomonadaceae bacterium]|nr:hypothetical protein [Pyrinomonadaceae bacterium]